jgi:hypothetical protein
MLSSKYVIAKVFLVKVFPLNEQFASFSKQKQFILFSLGLHLSEQVYPPPAPSVQARNVTSTPLSHHLSVSVCVKACNDLPYEPLSYNHVSVL